jgi:NADPH-dependent 2,4-dienoyl-CoA reductase/sulfur reductase-like enzyme
VRALAGCVANTARLIWQSRIHLPSRRVGMRMRFADRPSARVFRETAVDRDAWADPCVLVVEFRRRGGRGNVVAAGRGRVRAAADVLVVGAGPAGLALALQVRDHGAVVRVVDRRPEADRPSRALILHSRTLEVLRPLGVTQALLARANTAPTADLQLG